MHIHRKGLLLCTIALLSSFFWTGLHAQQTADTARKKVYLFTLHADIMPSAERLVTRALQEASALHADYILMDEDSYGGMLDSGDSIHIKLLRCPIPVLVYISNNAASAGALIALSCDSIYMAPFAKIGAASVVDQSGNIMPEKFQSYMRGIMRSTAEANHRDPDIAAAMVSGHKAVPGLIDSSEILTFTTSEAIKNHYCEGEATSPEDALHKAGITNYTIVRYVPTGMDKTMDFLLSPVLRSILIILIILGIYFELQHPGIGLPLFTAIIAALLYFAPLYLEGLAANWEILMFVIGLILLILEIFVIPGFGVTGILGIIFTFSGLVLAMLKNTGLHFESAGSEVIVRSVFLVMVSFIISLVFIIAFFGRFTRSRFFGKVALETTVHGPTGYTMEVRSHQELLGKTGIAVSILRPAGKVDIDGDYYDAQSEGDLIPKGSMVKVVSVKNTYLLVRLVPGQIT